jgi:hypothetical protein
MRGFYLTPQEDMPLATRIYGKRHDDRIVQAYTSRAMSGLSTGVWLTGEKGSGKTMLASLLSSRLRELGLSTILVQSNFAGGGFNAFIEHVGQACFVFDEFEKVYDAEDAQNGLLTMFSGSVAARNMYIITTNDMYQVRDAMRNRPSRMRYLIEYRGLTEDVVVDYVTSNLKDQTQVTAVIEALRSVPNCNFDIMMCVVEEHNRFGGPVRDLLAIMNVSRVGEVTWTCTFRGRVRKDDFARVYEGTATYEGHPHRGNDMIFALRPVQSEAKSMDKPPVDAAATNTRSESDTSADATNDWLAGDVTSDAEAANNSSRFNWSVELTELNEDPVTGCIRAVANDRDSRGKVLMTPKCSFSDWKQAF